MDKNQLTIESLEATYHDLVRKDGSLQSWQKLKRRVRLYAGAPGADLQRGRRLVILVNRRIKWKCDMENQAGKRSTSAGKKKEKQAHSSASKQMPVSAGA